MTYYIALVLCIQSTPSRYVTDSMGASQPAQAKQETRTGMIETYLRHTQVKEFET
jgi:hypothetical protein